MVYVYYFITHNGNYKKIILFELRTKGQETRVPHNNDV